MRLEDVVLDSFLCSDEAVVKKVKDECHHVFETRKRWNKDPKFF